MFSELEIKKKNWAGSAVAGWELLSRAIDFCDAEVHISLRDNYSSHSLQESLTALSWFFSGKTGLSPYFRRPPVLSAYLKTALLTTDQMIC